MKIKDKIKYRRKKLGLTMLEVANYVGVSEATVSRWEGGQISSLKQDKVELLTQILDVPISYLVVEDESLDSVDEKKLPAFAIVPPNILPDENIVYISRHTGTHSQYVLDDQQTNIIEGMIKQMPIRSSPASQVAYGGKENKSTRKKKKTTI